MYDEYKNNVFALKAMFPSIDAYMNFTEDNDGKIINSVIKYAFNKGIIHHDTEPAFKNFIIENKTELTCKPIERININDFKRKVSPYRDTAQQINSFIKKSKIKFSQINYSIFSRLINEECNNPTKRNAIRLISFWICYKKPELISVCNYNNLLELFGKINKPNNEEGCRIAFSLYSRGNTIGNDVVIWLKKELKKYISNNIKFTTYKNQIKLQFIDTTTLYIDIPKNFSNNINHLNHPESYAKVTNDAIDLAYQILILWFLSKFCTKGKFIAIGIAIGNFSDLNLYIQAILQAKLPSESVIRLTDYAHQCVLINNIRVRFCHVPKEVEIVTGEISNIWWITEFWNVIYWDFVPALLKESILKSEESLLNVLWFPDTINDICDSIYAQDSSIVTFLRSPQNILLGLEIAKTLYYRKKFWEANEIVRIILSFKLNRII
ncbi:hypothetical protein MHK_001550 [Candidatus Magnetomorum sp. HK-1]|nr:hypothetical protein MHK_001550 [Candidatus Magnetomorum sp. HK-1]